MAIPILAALGLAMAAKGASDQAQGSQTAQSNALNQRQMDLSRQAQPPAMEPTFQEAIRGPQAAATNAAVPGLDPNAPVTDALNAESPSPLKADSKLLADVAPDTTMKSVFEAQNKPQFSEVDINAQFNPANETPPPTTQKASIFGDMSGGEKAMVGAQLMSEVFRRKPGPAPPGLPSSSFGQMTPQFNRRY